ncbi:MAG: MBL fold metallo-hydrolase [Planctomycetes bacterium]|jgi:glyoxylase-like metal-dependent hydrolase (beta-lactamase superfamily II)|nr:MBL fold metallo-hydrolase [Planctomycetota bacterium]
MVGLVRIGMLVPLLLAATPHAGSEYVCIERLSPRVVLAYWLGTGRCNLTAIQTAKGLVMIDTEMSPRIMTPIKARIEQVFGRNDWAYVINTHAHDNHASGNPVFPGAVVVGHENLPRDMEWLVAKQVDPERKRQDIDHAVGILQNLQAVLPQVAGQRTNALRILGEMQFWRLYIQDMKEGFEVVKPTLTFPDRQVLDLGDLTLELVFFGKGHSLSDILIYVPQEKLLISGATVYQRAHLPEVAEETQLADVQRFIAVLDSFLAPDVQIHRVIPSHSPPLVKSDLRPARDYYVKMLAGVRAARQEGLTFEQTTQRWALRTNFPALRETPPGDWAHGMHDRNLRNLWRIVSAERQKAASEPSKN